MHMPYGTRRLAKNNEKAKLVVDYQDLLKVLSTQDIKSVGNYILENTIGEGTYGKVKLATHKLTGQKVAIKIIPKIHAENLTREIHHHRYLHHPNIISLFEVIPSENKIYMVLEYCEGGELYDFLVNRKRLKENLARKMFGQLCRAVKYCHDRRVVHRDLKLENILLDAHKNIKLGDFGFTREYESKKLLETICGSTGYSAPEMLTGKKYSGLEIDIWSLGVILYTLLCGSLPFDDDDENEMKLKIMKGEYEMGEFLSDEAKDLIKSILQLEPKERPTLKQILQHAWFTIKDEDDEDEDDDDDQWDTYDEVADDESLSSLEEKNEKEPMKQAMIIRPGNNNDAISHLERQRQEIFLVTKKQNAQNYYPTGFNRKGNDMASFAPSAFQTRFAGMATAINNGSTSASTSRKTLGPSTSKTSRRSSIDSKTFNEKIFFTTPEEKELLEKLEGLGFDVQAIKNSVLEGKVDSASGLWWLLLTRLREKRKIEGAQSSVTMVDVAVGTSGDELEITDDIEEEPDSIDSSVDSNRSSQEDDYDGKIAINSMKVAEKMLPPTPPPKTYHTAPASRERRKSLILSLPEAVEPVLTTITATASPPLSPKKYSSFTSPLSSRSVSPIPHISVTPITIQLPNNKDNRKKSILSTIKGWLGGSTQQQQQNHKDLNSPYKRSVLNLTESGVVVPADVARSRTRLNKRNDSKAPLSYDNTSNFNVRRRSSSVSRGGGSIRDKKKKNRNSFQGNKSRRSSTAPLSIPPVTPSVVLSNNSPIGMSPIPGTPPAVRHKTMFTINRRNPFTYTGNSWGRKQVKRRSTGGSSIGSIQENLETDVEFGSGSGSSENANNNYQDKDIFETSAIENISDDIVKNDTLNIDGQTIIVESSKSKTITLASPPPTPPPLIQNNNSEPSISKQKKIDVQKVDESSHKIKEDVTSSDDVSPPLSPADSNAEGSPTSTRKGHQRLNSLPTTLISGSGGKQRDVYIPPVDKPISIMDFVSTPPDSPKLPSPIITPSPSSTAPHPHITRSQLRQQKQHSRSYSSPINNISNSKTEDISHNETSRRDSPPSPPNGLNNAKLLFLHNNNNNNNTTNSRRNYMSSSSPLSNPRRQNLITSKPSVIVEEEEEE
ncbi:Pkinase-domain-containing protein [Gigaspora margarita]|uniref:non-specific serine/threonine protein kinase n=1 Tax=Gigaspora margarita TaxID=4874 RepID=A0A8H4EJJ7_GIGMA|nr:Pkinase-domain-containing protein [Gigaspora margarita]